MTPPATTKPTSSTQAAPADPRCRSIGMDATARHVAVAAAAAAAPAPASSPVGWQ